MSAVIMSQASSVEMGRRTARGLVAIRRKARLVCQGKPIGSSLFNAACNQSRQVE